jgi:DNA-binding CsgD family transcriptional regulator
MKREADSPGTLDFFSESFTQETFSYQIPESGKPSFERLKSNNFFLPFSKCLVDASGRQYACIHGECDEYTDCIKNEILCWDSDFHCLHFHPDDALLLCKVIFPEILKFMKSISEDDLTSYRFSFNHRYIRKDGSVSQFLQEGNLKMDGENGYPVLCLKVFTETGDIKTDDSMILTIFKHDPILGNHKIFSRIFRKNCDSILSHRELEIIRLCLEGMSSKMIADKLNISIHTVKNHKRNCMEKTCARNTAELINVCIKSNWL